MIYLEGMWVMLCRASISFFFSTSSGSFPEIYHLKYFHWFLWYSFKVLLNFMYAQGFGGIWFLPIYLGPPAQVFDYSTLVILGQPPPPPLPAMTSHQKIGSCGLHCSLEILCKFLKFSEVSTWNFDWNYRGLFTKLKKRTSFCIERLSH